MNPMITFVGGWCRVFLVLGRITIDRIDQK